MTDDFDRTQEIRRAPDWERGEADEPNYARQPYPQQAAAEGAPDYRQPDYRAPGSYAPGGPRPGYEPGARADKGGSGFPAATVGAVVGGLLMVLSSFLGYQVARNGSFNLRSWDGWFAQTIPLAPWPFDGGSSKVTTAFIAALVIVVFVVLLLLMAATMSVRAGGGSFAVFLSAWMTCVIGGAIARVVAGLIGRSDIFVEVVRADATSGATWGVVAGWIVGLATVAVHLMRRKPQTF
ncbi:hypothetical protein [Flexivirga meconopsidis]|uniref:hypothetical protein n=1 Tax=Flexivirga meconopsidis TaxID=2977121 RepID=UPI00223F0AD3|nr:hypothetical protein [Flexivirga meconopsidis]